MAAAYPAQPTRAKRKRYVSKQGKQAHALPSLKPAGLPINHGPFHPDTQRGESPHSLGMRAGGGGTPRDLRDKRTGDGVGLSSPDRGSGGEKGRQTPTGKDKRRSWIPAEGH